jgi:5'(3')-deoxyribonucleotidase
MAFRDATLQMNPGINAFSDIDGHQVNTPWRQPLGAFELFEFSAKFDPVPSMLVQNHEAVVADFYGYMRKIAAEWKGEKSSTLTRDVTYGMPEWKLKEGEYDRLHQFAVTQRGLFSKVKPIQGAAQTLRELSAEQARIRIITHRLYIQNFHQVAINQTVQWLDHHGIPYWDLCFMRNKAEVGADIYIEDTEKNIEELLAADKMVVIFSNSTNQNLQNSTAQRADDWNAAASILRDNYYQWLTEQGLSLPPAPGAKPSWAK